MFRHPQRRVELERGEKPAFTAYNRPGLRFREEPT